jgi:RNA ligase (TIGR02306 family)
MSKMSERNMATIRTIAELKGHPNADKLLVAVIDGWQCVTAKDNGFKQGDLVVYLEIDSWVPTEVASFLSKGKEPREYNNVKGERLRTIRLRGELSQGLILPLSVLPDAPESHYADGDVSELLNVQKWERPMNAQVAGQAKGYFPEFIRKTDQERIQNQFKRMQPEHFADFYEVTLKIDGSSCTFFHKDGVSGVCSRNLELKTDESNEGNAFVKMYRQLDIESKLQALGKNIAIQGELFGEGINGNWEGIKGHQYMVFDIFDIDKQSYLTMDERHDIVGHLGLQHVPVIQWGRALDFKSVQDFLEYASRPSIHNKVAEGVVFKSLTNPDYSFKAINNEYLLEGGE